MRVVLVSYVYNCIYYYHVPILFPKTAQLNIPLHYTNWAQLLKILTITHNVIFHGIVSLHMAIIIVVL